LFERRPVQRYLRSALTKGSWGDGIEEAP
jgi:hypothetical protein